MFESKQIDKEKGFQCAHKKLTPFDRPDDVQTQFACKYNKKYRKEILWDQPIAKNQKIKLSAIAGN